MLGALCRLVDGRTECKMAAGAAWKPIKDVMHLPTQASSLPHGQDEVRSSRQRWWWWWWAQDTRPAGPDASAGSSASSSNSSTRVT